MSSQKVFIALPVYRELDAFFVQSLIKLVGSADLPFELMIRLHPGDSLVSRSRNTLTADFLASDATDLLFIDTDLIFSADQIERICSHDKVYDKVSDKGPSGRAVDVVGGFYPKKCEGPIQWVCNACFEEQPILESGLQQVRYMGTGFLRVRRRVFERMIEAYPEIAYKPDNRQDRTEHDFWSVGVYRPPEKESRKQKAESRNGDETSPPPGRYLSEDWYFCQRWLDLGGEVWGDTRIVLKHVGMAVYPLKSQEHELQEGTTGYKPVPQTISGLSSLAAARSEGAADRIAPAAALTI